jgi:hypothetical protein
MGLLRWLIAIGCAAGCGGGEEQQRATVDAWEIRAGAPTFSGASVSGGFDAVGDGMRGFGACLLADLHGAKPCVTAADCATGALVPLVTGHHEYCVTPAGESRDTCWTRNGADMAWCNKLPPPGRVAGAYSTPSVEAAAIAGSGSKTRWMTLACLNAGTFPTFSDGPLPPCASADPAAASYEAHAASAVSTYTAP